MRELVLDTETTGLDPSEHRIVELACVELNNFIATGRTWHWYFNPERDVPKAAVDVHGLDNAFLADKPLFRHLAHEIAELLTGATLIIHNAAFDIGFLKHELARCERANTEFGQVIDTLALSRRKHPGSPNTLDALCRRYAIDNSARTKHGALLDCELLAEVYLKLMGAEQAGLNFAAAPVVSLRAQGQATRAAVRPVALPPRLTAEEAEAHRQFVASLGEKAIWASYRANDGLTEQAA
jgi:DNA polymerase-3 subunit epsilon